MINDTDSQISIIGFNMSDTKDLVSMLIFILCVTLIKLGYFWGHKVTKYLPESSLLLFIGIGFGYVLKATYGSVEVFAMNSKIFMYFLLPPIVLESAFAMYHTDFMSNILGVLVFAIVATILNFIFLSFTLWGLVRLHVIESSINIITILLFCALITSVDPVAVLAIFQEIKVDNNLYYLVFGESLLNDGVSVVLYNVLNQLASIPVWHGMHYFKAIISFCAVAIGGGVVGTVISIITCIMSKFTFKSPLSEPIIVFGMSMLAYTVAGILGWSVIISMIMYGVIQVAYNFENITHKSLIVIKRLAKILANLSESVIFLSLGVTLFGTEQLRWNSPFSLWSLFLCIYTRFIFTFLLSAVINHYKLTVRKLEWNEQFILAYGGMRGGIAYCLSVLLVETNGIDKKSIMDATICIIIFTVVFMGITMKPLVAMLDIKKAGDDELSLFDQINDSVIKHSLACIEAILDNKGRYSFYEFSNNLNVLFVKEYLQRNPVNYEAKLLEIYKVINLKLYMANAAGSDEGLKKFYLKRLKPYLRRCNNDNFEKVKEQKLDENSIDYDENDLDMYIDILKSFIEEKNLNESDICNMNSLILAFNKKTSSILRGSFLLNKSPHFEVEEREISDTNTEKHKLILHKS